MQMTFFRVLAAVFLLATITAGTQAATKTCKISVVGGSFKGRSYPLKMSNGAFVETGGVSKSSIGGCLAKKFIYGRWYHICRDSRIIVYRREGDGWKRLAAKNLKKYRHDCI